jgi:ubiquinone/menaquinone biosynthesis C-methylase UbiE
MKHSQNRAEGVKWNWDRIALEHDDDRYASVICVGGEKSLNRYINRRHQEVIGRHASGRKIRYYLDAACGTGRFLERGRRISEATFGLDYSSNMLRIAKKNVHGAELTRGDLTELPYKDTTFDLITCVITLKLLRPKEKFLKCVSELIRVTRVNGRIIIIEDVRRKQMESNGVLIHTTEQMKDAFINRGVDLKVLQGTRIAHPIRMYKRLTGLILRIMAHNKTPEVNFSRTSRLQWAREKYPVVYSLYKTGFKIALTLNEVVDRFFAPRILQSFATEKVFVFQKRGPV